MKKFLIASICLGLVMSLSACTKKEDKAKEEQLQSQSQPSEPQTPKYYTAADIERLEKLTVSEPDNYEHHMDLANAYGSAGRGSLVVKHIEKALELNPEEAIKKQAYVALSMGHYYAGNFKKSYEAIQKELSINPNNQNAITIKQMLDTVSQRDFGGKIPEKIASAEDYVMSMQKLGAGMLGPKEDMVALEKFNIYFTCPEGWHKEANVPTPVGTKILLQYKKSKDTLAPMIGVTTDDPERSAPGIKTAIEYTRLMKKTLPPEFLNQVSITEPRTVKINGLDAAYMEITGQNSSAWYQFLIDGIIVSVQYANTNDVFRMHYSFFKGVVSSMRVVKK